MLVNPVAKSNTSSIRLRFGRLSGLRTLELSEKGTSLCAAGRNVRIIAEMANRAFSAAPTFNVP